MVKSTQFEQNWVLFFPQLYTDGWVIVRKIGIEKVKFSRSSRHIHAQFGESIPSGGLPTPTLSSDIELVVYNLVQPMWCTDKQKKCSEFTLY